MTDMVKIISPVDGSVYAMRPRASQAEIDAVLSQARAAQAEWAGVAIAERARLAVAAVDAMLAMAEEIVPELAWQMGRPVRFGRGELDGFAERARHMIAIAADSLADVVPGPKPGFTRFIRREPVGVVFTVAPWNYPYLTAVNSVIPALMAGNAVILKHARHTLLVGERFEQAFAEADLPDGLFHNLVLSHDQTSEIIADRMTDMVCFTGSVAGGAALEAAAAGRFLRLGLELGGKDPAYVRPDADLDHAVENLVDGAFFNTGQSCCAIERLYVHTDLFDRFVDGFTGLARQYVLGDPLQDETTLGPMINAEAAELVRDQIACAVRAGASCHIDEADFARSAPGTPYLAPQVLTRVDHQMSVMRDESFGPVIGIMKVADDDEAVALMNDSAFGLTASVWTRDEDAALGIGARLDTGTVFMNRCDYLDPALAWSGVGNSGRGATLSSVGYEQLTRPKSFHLRTDLAP